MWKWASSCLIALKFEFLQFFQQFILFIEKNTTARNKQDKKNLLHLKVSAGFIQNVAFKLYCLYSAPPVFCEQCHACLPVLCGWCLICVTVFCGWCRVCVPVFCEWCLIGFCAFSGWCLVVLPVCGWWLCGMFWKVEAVALGCLANFWLHCLGDIIVVSKPGWRCQSTLRRSTSQTRIWTQCAWLLKNFYIWSCFWEFK